ncbi:MAG: ADP-ribosylglycohydrolase family protein [Firmicutes bacterium]|nr:ADP-ribosylglycohydrolase family protein [Bacillota bacterium]
MKSKQDKFRGSMIGGAAGDALGYAVEFMTLDAIRGKYGEKGITNYELDPKTGKALISDDTQMTLFTANGVLLADTFFLMHGVGSNPVNWIQKAYYDWLTIQMEDYELGHNMPRYSYGGGYSWLLDVPELYSRRAPGGTCISAIREILLNDRCDDPLENPINDSKGCGGIMRVAPFGMFYPVDMDVKFIRDAGAVAAITHGHPLGYMPAAVLAYIVSKLIWSEAETPLKSVVLEAKNAVCETFSGTACVDDLRAIIDRAVELSENGDSDEINIRRLGEGWVAEETLAIAIYCSLRYEHDFSGGIIAAVNHDGDSDSTGAVTGNILGAICGYEGMDPKWKENLELHDVILEMADDLANGCPISEYSNHRDPDWERKYIHIYWRELTARQKNWIIMAVNARETADEAGLKSVGELQYYHDTYNEAMELFERGGVWPIFDLWELD